MRLFLVASLALVACANPRHETSSSTKQPIVCAPAATSLDAHEPVAANLTRTAWTPNGNHHPVARFVWKGLDLGEGIAAVSLGDGAAVVRADGALDVFDTRGCPRTIANDAMADLTVSPDGHTIAFVRATGDGTALSLYRDGKVWRIVSAWAEADRPLFIDERTLLFVGAARPGVSRFHRVSLEHNIPEPLPIEGIPATRDGYVIENGVVHFHDGELLRSGGVR